MNITPTRIIRIGVLLLGSSLHSVSAYITSGLPGHTHRAWLKKMTTDVCELPPGDLTPEMCTTTPQLLSAWSQNPYIPHTIKQSFRDVDIFPHHGKECALACEQLVKRLVDERRAGNVNVVVDTDVYNSLIDVWSRSGEGIAAAQRVEQILVHMQESFEAGDLEVQPNLESFRLAILAWSKVGRGDKNAAKRAEAVLEWMIELHESGRNNQARPNSDCFDLVLYAWALSHHDAAPHKTEQLLMWMDMLYLAGNEDVKPTRMSFNQVLTAWSRSAEPDSAQRAEDILIHMDALSSSEGNESIKPNIVSYNTVVSAWGKTIGQDDAARRADNILKEAEKKYHEEEDFRLDSIIYNIVINAYAKSSSNKAHLRARTVLKRQTALHESGANCKPDVYSFTTVLSSCASLSGSRKERVKAFNIATETFHQMCDSNVAPNHVTYGIMVKSCLRLLPAGSRRQRMAMEYFKKACQDGCVGTMVLSRYREIAKGEKYQKMMKGIDMKHLPPEWTWQVPESEKNKWNKRSKKNAYP